MSGQGDFPDGFVAGDVGGDDADGGARDWLIERLGGVGVVEAVAKLLCLALLYDLFSCDHDLDVDVYDFGVVEGGDEDEVAGLAAVGCYFYCGNLRAFEVVFECSDVGRATICIWMQVSIGCCFFGIGKDCLAVDACSPEAVLVL